MPVFTVGNERGYDAMLADHGPVKKVGQRDGYPGGFACRSAQDAARLIVEKERAGVWAVYELDADWERDTVPSVNGWWHALINDSVILRKVEAS